MIKVYHGSPCPFGRKVLAVLNEKNLDFEIERVSLTQRDHEKAAFLKLNPRGELPVLADEQFVLNESTAIVEYLEDEYPEPRLMPPDSEGRARVRMIDDFCDLHLYKAFGTAMKKILVEKGALADDDKKAIRTALDATIRYLGDQKFLVGEFSLADCAVMPVIPWFEQLGLPDEGVSDKLLRAYFDRLKERRGYAGANYEASTVW